MCYPLTFKGWLSPVVNSSMIAQYFGGPSSPVSHGTAQNALPDSRFEVWVDRKYAVKAFLEAEGSFLAMS